MKSWERNLIVGLLVLFFKTDCTGVNYSLLLFGTLSSLIFLCFATFATPLINLYHHYHHHHRHGYHLLSTKLKISQLENDRNPFQVKIILDTRLLIHAFSFFRLSFLRLCCSHAPLYSFIPKPHFLGPQALFLFSFLFPSILPSDFSSFSRVSFLSLDTFIYIMIPMSAHNFSINLPWALDSIHPATHQPSSSGDRQYPQNPKSPQDSPSSCVCHLSKQPKSETQAFPTPHVFYHEKEVQ